MQEYRFCFTLDTEPDNLWAGAKKLGFEHFLRLPDFHRRLVDAGARPTYLTTSEVVEAERGRRAMDCVLEAGQCEVGAHFHTWTRAWPFLGSDHSEFPRGTQAHQLGQRIEEAMLRLTCESLHASFGIYPKSYRGGCWSLGKSTLISLENCGIEVDSTVTPGLSWKSLKGGATDGPDFRRASPYPHWLGEPITARPSSVMEIPVGSAWVPERARPVFEMRYVGGAIRRAAAMFGFHMGFGWLRPTNQSVGTMRAVLQSLKRSQVPTWVFMIHSSEIAPCKPLPSEEEVEAFKNRCVGAIRTAVELGAQPATLIEAKQWILKRGFELHSLLAGQEFRDDGRNRGS